jgi:hypothetical protein
MSVVRVKDGGLAFDQRMDEILVWPGQADFLQASAKKIGLFTGAGYGKSKVLVMRALMDHAKQDGWWEGRLDYDENPLVMVMAAPNSAYLTRRTVPEFRGTLAAWEEKIGRQLTKPTGRARNGWFDSKDERRCEMANGVKFLFYGMHDEKAAVASDIIALYMDEITMLENEQIWSRAKNRVRDSRGMDGFLLVAGVGTPEKGHFVYEEYYDPDTDQPRPGVQVFSDTSLNNPTLTWKFCDDMVGNSDAYIEMQAMGKWVKGIGGQRLAHLFDEERHLKVLDWPVDYPGIKYDIGWDPGWATGSVIVAYHHPQKNLWCVYDEIVIQGMDTEDAAKELLKRGYNWNNIRYIGMDPRDASKHRSSGKHTDADIVFRILRVRPHYKDVRGYNAVLRLRLEAVEELLKNDRIVFNKKLKPTNRKKGGIINGIKNFSLEAIKDIDEKFDDRPDAATIKYWKHPIDALHYILMEYEHSTYGKAVRDFKVDKLAAKTFGGFKKYSRQARR